MKLQHMKRRVQRGFTLVELAIVLVIAGLILVAVLRGTDAIQKAQVERMVSDLRGMQGILLEFQKRNNRLPGDCNNDGILANHDQTPKQATLLNTAAWNGNAGTDTVLDFSPEFRALPAAPIGTDATGAGGNGPARGVCVAADTEEAHVNLVWNELRRAGIVDSNRLPRELARHSMGDVFLVSTMFDGAAPTLTTAPTAIAGVIVVYGIPVWMAEAVDAAIDGAATLYGAVDAANGPANSGRVRLWSPTAAASASPVNQRNVFVATSTQHASYDGGDRDRDRLIAISFQYTPNKLIR